MKIAILGSGNGGCTAAADMSLLGHDVSIWDFEQFPKNINAIVEKGGIKISGAIEGFAKLRYAGFDIEKAMAQAREAQIETSLERVRAQAMAMRTPEDLTGICEVLYAELNSLGFAEIRNAMINIHDDEKETFVNYDYSDEIGKSINHLTYHIHPLLDKQ